MLVGLDLGATLHKVALADEIGLDPSGADASRVRLDLRTFPASGDDALAHVRRAAPRAVVLIGGRANDAARALAPLACHTASELDAWALGAAALAARQGLALPARHLLVSLGTGSSILLVENGLARRVGGTALGGGTLLGLGSLLVGTARFSELCELAARGSRTNVDLLVGDIYPRGGIALESELTASNFGKVASRRREDLACAVLGLIGENVALVAGALASAHGVECVAYGGSTVAQNPVLRAILDEITRYAGARPLFLPDPGYCGAVGCLAFAGRPQE